MKKCISRLLLFVLGAMLILTGCSSSQKNGAQKEETDDGIQIGMSFDSFVIERWQKDRDVFVSTAQSLGATVNVQNANGDVDKQKEQIRYLIDKQVDVLVIIPTDSDAMNDVVEEAKDAGIKVVAYDRVLYNCDADLYISFDNKMVGSMMGQAIVDTGAKSAVMICGPHTDSNVSMIEDGFMEVADANGLEIIDKYYADGWKAELGSAYVYDNTDKVNQADAIMCGNDDLATAVIRALAVSQLAGVKPVVGQDADLPACQHIVEGTQIMTVYKPVEKLAAEAAKLSVDLANGQAIDVDETINDGSCDVPYVAIEPVAVTKDNMDEIIIAGGFHSYDDVYMNVVAETEEEATDTEDEALAE